MTHPARSPGEAPTEGVDELVLADEGGLWRVTSPSPTVYYLDLEAFAALRHPGDGSSRDYADYDDIWVPLHHVDAWVAEDEVFRDRIRVGARTYWCYAPRPTADYWWFSMPVVAITPLTDEGLPDWAPPRRAPRPRHRARIAPELEVRVRSFDGEDILNYLREQRLREQQ